MAELTEPRAQVVPGRATTEVVVRGNPTTQAFRLLHVAFIAAPTIAGLDKFLHLLVDWNQYLAPPLARAFGAQQFMSVVGVIEIAAGLLVALRPRIGAYVVSAWLAGIIVNLLATGHYFDVALRDFGLMLAALALARLAAARSIASASLR